MPKEGKLRAQSKLVRRGYTDQLKASGCSESRDFAKQTNWIYERTLGMDAGGLRHHHGLSKSQSIRDHLPMEQLAAVSFVESLVTKHAIVHGTPTESAVKHISAVVHHALVASDSWSA